MASEIRIMASEIRIQDMVVVQGTVKQDHPDAADFGAYRHWILQVRVLRPAGTSGTLQFQHAATREEEAFVDIANATVNHPDQRGVGPSSASARR